MLPKSTLSFTIPSICDDTPLDCRVYHPSCLNGAGPGTRENYAEDIEVMRRRDKFGRKIWRKKAAIVAHPYAPLGGCYDDPVVSEVVEVLLIEGWIIGTFNFRGAYGSKGSTSWTTKPELEDYKSFIGFMTYYMHHLQAPKPSNRHRRLEDGQDVPDKEKLLDSNFADPTNNLSNSHLLLLGGYSYGSLITINLPSTSTILETNFRIPELGSAAGDIRLRAQHLAIQQNEVWDFVMKTSEAENIDHRGRHPASPETRRNMPSGGVRMGGEEGIENMRRMSREARSVDSAFRRSIEKVRGLGKHARTESSSAPTPGIAATMPRSQDSSTCSLKGARERLEFIEPEGLDSTQTCYLLISPLQGVTRSLLCMSFLEKIWTRDQISAKEEYKKLVFPNSTLAVYGDVDGFSNAKQQRAWMELLGPEKNLPLEIGFKYQEIMGAGHFWRERDVMRKMRGHLQEWLRALQK